ncbi:MAG: hypothetical protein LBC75_02505 [Fibromonadaceae bacterium]|jgi:hypothetical protein|nr:hypothetical protein [Fibromonadaceae bacterium]
MKEVVKHPMRWLALNPGDWADVYYRGTIEEKAAVLDDIVETLLKNQEPKILYNKIIVARSHDYYNDLIARRKKRSEQGSEIYKKQNKELKELKETLGISKAPSLFDDVKTAEQPTREQALQFAESIGAILANDWYDWCVENNWHDKSQKPINNWKRALRAYEERKNPDFKPPPETAQQQEDNQ